MLSTNPAGAPWGAPYQRRKASKTKRFPGLSLGLGALACLLMLVPQAVQQSLYLDLTLLNQGHWWVLISGHWLHADMHHLAWNVIALMILAALIERRSRRLLLLSTLAGMICVDLLLLSPFTAIQRYCGLSGLLNTLLGVALYLYWKETRSMLIVLTAVLCVGKIGLEMYSGQSLFTDTSWPPFAASHLAGALGVPVALCGWRYIGRRRKEQEWESGLGRAR